ncbi:MAG: spore germination protein [Firmicutes bacterium]|nr:spore germination protein [Bacillota bacterium]
MWPWSRQTRLNKTSQQSDAQKPGPHIKAGAARLTHSLNDTQSVLRSISGVDTALLKQLISQTSALNQELNALTQELNPHTSLDQFTGDIEAVYQRLQSGVGQSPDIIIRRFLMGDKAKIPAVLTFVDGLTDTQMIDQDTIMLAQQYDHAFTRHHDPQTIHQVVHDLVTASGHVTTETSWNKLMVKLMGGNTILFLSGSSTALVIDTVKYRARSLTTPTTERSVLGPQEAFNEVVLTQMNLLRMRIKSPNLRFDSLTIGEMSHTTVIVAHIEGLTNPELVAAVKRKLSVAKMATLNIGQELTPLLASRYHSLFPQVRRTERPDVVARELTMGKVAILVDNTPFAMVVPNTLADFYQTLEDYTMSFWGASLERLVRFLGLILGLLLPPLYIALTSVNPELLPTKLVITIAGSRVGLPLPPVMEVLTMWAIIEILREASLRLPKELSNTLGTVGAIVVGTAIVKAGIVSPLMIVIITLTALGLFTSPNYEMATPWRVLFWFLIALSYLFGLFGIILGLLAILAHLASLENFGVPYLSPFGPYRWRDLKDTFVRFPESSLTKRPAYLQPLDVTQSSHWHVDPMPHPQLGQAQKEEQHG